ncbi:hypothetical protein BDW60DRAFT_222251 [Aspergillus nidulans var. acristatus]
MNPNTAAFVPGHPYQQSHGDVASINNFPDSNTAPYISSSDITPRVSEFPSMEALRTSLQTLSGAYQDTCSLADRSQTTMMAQQLPGTPRETELVSRSSQRPDPSPLHRLSNLDLQDAPERSQVLAVYTQSVDKTTNPGYMPIGSLVNLKGPPKWGVVKISNIPYGVTKPEVFQFIGRQARPITEEMGCPIHIIMERSTAKTMDCYVEFQTVTDAYETVKRINRVHSNGRVPRLGGRHVDVEISDQDALLKDLFPRANCVKWEAGMPKIQPNHDQISCSGFNGFFTSEEIIMAIRHAELPRRSPFSEKCPQRTYESTISTIYKFPWYAPWTYTVADRNQLFELANRHIQCLATGIKHKTVGLLEKLLRELLQAGLSCPGFSERQKYTLCMNSQIESEINKLSVMSKWFPFDTLSNKPDFHEDIHTYYADLISQGVVPDLGNSGLINKFPKDIPYLSSPYGCIWLEWSQDAAKVHWEDAVEYEMKILHDLVLHGWMNDDRSNMLNLNLRRPSGELSFPRGFSDRRNMSLSLYPSDTEESQAQTDSSSRSGVYISHFRRASESAGSCSISGLSGPSSTWTHALLLDSSFEARPAYRHHRKTESSPMCLTPTTNNWNPEMTS